MSDSIWAENVVREQARHEIAEILNGKLPRVNDPIFDALREIIEVARWVAEQSHKE